MNRQNRIQTAEPAEQQSGQAKKIVAWTFCKKCKSTYPATQLICTFCYNMAKEKPEGNLLESSFARSLETRCGETYPLGIKRMNIDYPVRGELTCVVCTQSEKCACENFGLIPGEKKGFTACKREEFDSCPCKQCCAKAKRFKQGYRD